MLSKNVKIVVNLQKKEILCLYYIHNFSLKYYNKLRIVDFLTSFRYFHNIKLKTLDQFNTEAQKQLITNFIIMK